MSLTAQKRARIRRGAQQTCEYCRLQQRASILPHQVDHIISQQHGGTDQDSNLCLCCLHCNLKKGPNIASLDPETDHSLVGLFHPRKPFGKIIFNFLMTGALLVRLRKGARLRNFWTSTRSIVYNSDKHFCDRVGTEKITRERRSRVKYRGWTEIFLSRFPQPDAVRIITSSAH